MKINRQTGMTTDSIKKVFQSMIAHEVSINESIAVIHIECSKCGTAHIITLPKDRYIIWQTGTSIQHVFPEMDANIRELLISGICGKCFDSLLE